MKWPCERSISGKILTVALGSLVLTGVAAYRGSIKLTQAAGAAERSHRVLGKLESLLSELKDAEAGQRGFLITGKESYLEVYDVAVEAIRQDLEELEDLNAESPDQRRTLKTLEPLIGSKLAGLQSTIDLRRQKGFEAAKRVLLSDRGKQLMDEIRKAVADMESQEDEPLRRHEQMVRASARTATLASLIGSSLSLALLARLLFLRIQFPGRRNGEKDAVHKVA
jgi:CHASE3 domain sensor protein